MPKSTVTKSGPGTVTPGPVPDPADYDLVVVQISAGKDSQVALAQAAHAVERAGVPERLVVVHADLGAAEWEGAKDLAVEHARHYDRDLRIVARRREDGQVETILERVEKRGMWPGPGNARWCTSDHKVGPGLVLLTALVKDLRESGRVTDRPVRILHVLGMRAEESSERAKKDPYRYDKRASNGRRHVDVWLPVHAWTVRQVWDGIRAEGTRHHFAYDAGMSRLSCTFCPLASAKDLRCAYEHNRAKGNLYLAMEKRIGHRFQARKSLAQLLEDPGNPDFEQLTLC
ncbi:phosphoadenosine phosphosulfate reductase family protein [Nocardiopsis sp. NPDC006198]|uniref:phosphoadenosine phosphosulfate reductase domain-containing protein n=1 Tax=Nocardiopsis sp. NPDC006198 TaxID=3154472 RepID=UPI0033BDAB96